MLKNPFAAEINFHFQRVGRLSVGAPESNAIRSESKCAVNFDWSRKS
jgi:hypothetical protein